jgi:hypothetical protein
MLKGREMPHRGNVFAHLGDMRPVTLLCVLGRIAEQPSPEYCSISSLRSDLPLVNGTDRPKSGHVRADRQLELMS